MSETKDPYIAALLRERAGYVAFGKTDRVKAVDDELKRRGYEPERTATPKKAEPRQRVSKSAKQSTADADATKSVETHKKG
jgi:hypothetical protein